MTNAIFPENEGGFLQSLSGILPHEPSPLSRLCELPGGAGCANHTHALKEIDSGKLAGWSTKRPPDLAMQYWDLKEDATMRDLILAVPP